MDLFDVRKIQTLEEIERVSKEIQNLIIEKKQNINSYDEKLKTLYSRMYVLNRELLKLIPPIDKEQT
jgi:hypothetical protein